MSVIVIWGIIKDFSFCGISDFKISMGLTSDFVKLSLISLILLMKYLLAIVAIFLELLICSPSKLIVLGICCFLELLKSFRNDHLSDFEINPVVKYSVFVPSIVFCRVLLLFLKWRQFSIVLVLSNYIFCNGTDFISITLKEGCISHI